jgi:elongator complex protein 5
VLAVYHTDVPLVQRRNANEYEPNPLAVLCHLATAILRVSSLYHAIERKRAQDRSLQEPDWGLAEGREGVLIGLKPKHRDDETDGIVVEMEMRRRSGRAVKDQFVLIPASTAKSSSSVVRLLSDHPVFAKPPGFDGEINNEEADEFATTFNLGLTDKQRRDREGVVLPYFDAQTDIGGGDGGRIIYEMGREDDFDDEEDEI